MGLLIEADDWIVTEVEVLIEIEAAAEFEGLIIVVEVEERLVVER